MPGRKLGRVKEGELAQAPWERKTFVESTTVFSRARERKENQWNLI